MTVAEAMARACPVVVLRQEPFTEYVDEFQTRLFYELGQAKDAAIQVRRLLVNESLPGAIGQQGRAAILSRFSAEVASRKLAEQLHSLSLEQSPLDRTLFRDVSVQSRPLSYFWIKTG